MDFFFDGLRLSEILDRSMPAWPWRMQATRGPQDHAMHDDARVRTYPSFHQRQTGSCWAPVDQAQQTLSGTHTLLPCLVHHFGTN